MNHRLHVVKNNIKIVFVQYLTNKKNRLNIDMYQQVDRSFQENYRFFIGESNRKILKVHVRKKSTLEIALLSFCETHQ